LHCGARRRAQRDHPAEQSLFNGLMILRFMRDDAMTLPARNNCAARGKKALAGFVVSFLSQRGGKNSGSMIRNGDPHDACRDASGAC
jgi:hypothetical protein